MLNKRHRDVSFQSFEYQKIWTDGANAFDGNLMLNAEGNKLDSDFLGRVKRSHEVGNDTLKTLADFAGGGCGSDFDGDVPVFPFTLHDLVQLIQWTQSGGQVG